MADVALIVACLRRYSQHQQHTFESGSLQTQTVTEAPGSILTAEEALIEGHLRDPIRTSLLGLVRDEGWKAFVNGGLDEMHSVLDAVDEAMQDDPNAAGAVLDKWWDGVGTGAKTPGWAA